MSIFKEHKTSADRSVTDRRRHRSKIEKAIREGVHSIIAEESIIGQDGKKKIRIPVRGIKEYRFVFGDNQSNKKVGSAPGKNIKRGQQVGPKDEKQQTAGNAGDEKGVEYYEVEITLEELASYLFDSLELPDLEKKTFKKLLSERFKRHGHRNQGIRPRLDKKQTLKKKLKRKAAAERNKKMVPKGSRNDSWPLLSVGSENEERFPFHNDDLRYKHIRQTSKESTNAVIFFLMDVSGSMNQTKKYLARSFYFLLYQFLRHKYESIDLIFIAHDVAANEVNEDQFFKRGSGGGTMVSSAIDLALEIINQRYHPSAWNIYTFHCSDGDNWPNDMEKCVDLTARLKDICQLYGYCEIEPSRDAKRWGDLTTLSEAYEYLEDHNFKVVKIFQNEDIWPAFKRLFGGQLGV
jgi:sporulation protein YhbH